MFCLAKALFFLLTFTKLKLLPGRGIQHPAVNFLALQTVYMRQSKVFRPDPICRHSALFRVSFDGRKIPVFFCKSSHHSFAHLGGKKTILKNKEDSHKCTQGEICMESLQADNLI
jgi:hypothetical protein